MGNYEPNSARDLINRFLDSIGAQDRFGVVPFVQAWPRIVGQDCAAHSQVMDVQHGTVVIGVDHPAWLQRLHMDRNRTLSRIKRDFPDLNARNLVFTIVSRLDTAWHGSESPASTPNPDPDPQPIAAQEPPAPPESPATDDPAFQAQLKALKRAIERNDQGRTV